MSQTKLTPKKWRRAEDQPVPPWVMGRFEFFSFLVWKILDFLREPDTMPQ
jgi:hypothetical protein